LSASTVSIESAVRKRLIDFFVASGYAVTVTRRRYFFDDEFAHVIVELQKSSKSRNGDFVFSLNIGIWSQVISHGLGKDDRLDKGVASEEWHWWLRAGQLNGGEETWWSLKSHDDVDHVFESIRANFLVPAIRLFVSLCDPKDMLKYFSQNIPPFLDQRYRWAYVLFLAKHLDKEDEQRTAIGQLALVAEKFALPEDIRHVLDEAA
jgi:hypothetical protein